VDFCHGSPERLHLKYPNKCISDAISSPSKWALWREKGIFLTFISGRRLCTYRIIIMIIQQFHNFHRSLDVFDFVYYKKLVSLKIINIFLSLWGVHKLYNRASKQLW
jgi:hypothetical protein